MNRSGIYCVRWWSSPTAARYLERLECRGEATPDQLAAECHSGHQYALNLCRVLHVAGVIRVSGWRHNSNGSPTPIYALGRGRDARMPKPETSSQRSIRRRKSLIALYGRHATSIILKNTHRPGRVVQDGRTLRPGDHDAHLAGKVSR